MDMAGICKAPIEAKAILSELIQRSIRNLGYNAARNCSSALGGKPNFM